MTDWKILFWNLRRLGLSTDEDRRSAIIDAVTRTRANYSFFCELTASSLYPAPFLSKGKNPRQLCYACLDHNGHDVALEYCDPKTTDEFEVAHFKGGTNFSRLANRGIGKLALPGNATIYVIHAPATNSAAMKVMSYLACWADSIHDKAHPYLIIGDLNIEPELLETTRADIDMTDHIVRPAESTYMGRNADKCYDYVLTDAYTKPNTTCDRLRRSARLHGSDHYPIVVDWTVP